MTDIQILDLFEQRSESAISEMSKQYGSYCSAIAMNILKNREDSEECVNDTFLRAWNSIPPKRPIPLSTFLGRITRNLSLDRYEARNTKKRGGDTALLLSELESFVPSAQNVEDEVDSNELSSTIDSFLSTVSRDDKSYFVCRYWHIYSISEIAKKFNVGESKVKVSLHRTRKKLRNYLEKRGISV